MSILQDLYDQDEPGGPSLNSQGMVEVSVILSPSALAAVSNPQHTAQCIFRAFSASMEGSLQDEGTFMEFIAKNAASALHDLDLPFLSKVTVNELGAVQITVYGENHAMDSAVLRHAAGYEGLYPSGDASPLGLLH